MAKEKIRVMRVIARLNIGGPAIHVGLLARGLEEHGFDTLLVAGSLGEDEGDMAYHAESLGVEVSYIPRLKRELSLSDDLRAFLALLRLMRRFRPQIIHTHTAKAGALGRAAGIIYNLLNPGERAILVHTFHGHVLHGYFGYFRSRLFTAIERLLAPFTRRLVVLSPGLLDELSTRFGVAPEERFSVVPLGLDLSSFIHCQSGSNAVLEEAGERLEGPLVGMVGRLVPVKNHGLFLRSLKLLREKMPGARGLVVGDGELRGELEDLAESLSLSGSVAFTGWRRNLAEVYGGLDAVALTSLNEGTPVSLIEAMAAGVPVVATGVGGVPDLLGEETRSVERVSVRKRGVMVPRDDPEVFARGLELALSDEAVRRETVSRARDFVLKNYTSDRLVLDIKRLYLELLAERGRIG